MNTPHTPSAKDDRIARIQESLKNALIGGCSVYSLIAEISDIIESHRFNPYTCPRHIGGCSCNPRDESMLCNPYYGGKCNESGHLVEAFREALESHE